MACVHTGCQVYLTNYGRLVHCDAHQIGDAAVFRIVGDCDWDTYDPARHYQVLDVGSGWFDERSPTSTLVVPMHMVIAPLSEAKEERWR